MLAPPKASQPLLRWARGHCRYPEYRVTPRISFKSKMKGKTCAHARVSYGSHLLAQGCSRAITCLVAPAPATRARDSSGTATRPGALAPVSWCRTAPGPPRAKCRSGFAILPLVLLPEQPVVVLLLERALVSWSSAIDEHGEQEDLRGSGCRSVIPYIHGRMVLYCSSLALLV
jgi:hypothetical protein